MINMLKTDSFSGSMQEFLYGSNVVITGSWLPYEIFDKEGIMYKKINNPSELSNILIEVMNDLPNLKMGLSRNIDIISNLSSWDNNIQSWIDAYEK
jgi:glycosyltransferase involved in cell wall biosynthesis